MYNSRYKNNNAFKGFFPVLENVINEVANTPIQNLNQENNSITARPKANILEHEDRYEIAIAMPGFSKKEINIELDKNELTVSASKEETSDKKYKLREFATNNMKRIFKVPNFINREEIRAEFKNGILNIQLFKAEEVKPKAITIK
jgi:HSP20 family protein